MSGEYPKRPLRNWKNAHKKQAARKRQRGFASGLAQTPIRAAQGVFFRSVICVDVRLSRRPSAQREGGGAASAALPAEGRRLVSRQAHVL